MNIKRKKFVLVSYVINWVYFLGGNSDYIRNSDFFEVL